VEWGPWKGPIVTETGARLYSNTMHEDGLSSYAVTSSPLGDLLLRWKRDRLVEIRFGGEPAHDWQQAPHTPFGAEAQLAAYFAGQLTQFDLPITAHGTSFQQQVWAQLLKIPYGVTMTYGELAGALGRPTASRAVGGANHRNPLPIVIPCHRVIGAGGRLTGYAGGLDIKLKLIELERRVQARSTTAQPDSGSDSAPVPFPNSTTFDPKVVIARK
jgi:methylated-DNA-[protein]-cysteine S-methyltransferase